MTSLKNRINEAFAQIQAEEELKKKTMEHLLASMNHNTAGNKKTADATPTSRSRRPLIAIAAALLILFSGGGLSYNLLFTAHAYVDLDVNPSLSLSLNALGQVIESHAYNEDGQDILALVQIQRKPYSQAVDLLFTTMADQGYLQTSRLISATVQANQAERETKMLAGVEDAITASLSAQSSAADWEVYAVSGQLRHQAQAHHLSPAKYLAIQELSTLDPSVTVESCADHSLSEIRERTHQHQQRQPQDQPQNRQGESNGHGHGHKEDH